MMKYYVALKDTAKDILNGVINVDILLDNKYKINVIEEVNEVVESLPVEKIATVAKVNQDAKTGGLFSFYK